LQRTRYDALATQSLSLEYEEEAAGKGAAVGTTVLRSLDFIIFDAEDFAVWSSLLERLVDNAYHRKQRASPLQDRGDMQLLSDRGQTAGQDVQALFADLTHLTNDAGETRPRDTVGEAMGACPPNVLFVSVVSVENARIADRRSRSSDPFVRLECTRQLVQDDFDTGNAWKTPARMRGHLSAVWSPHETYAFDVEHHMAALTATVYDYGGLGHTQLGAVTVDNLSDLVEGKLAWFELKDRKGAAVKGPGGKPSRLKLWLRWTHVSKENALGGPPLDQLPLPSAPGTPGGGGSGSAAAASGLPPSQFDHKRFFPLNQLVLRIVSGRDLPKMDNGVTSDPIATVLLNKKEVGQTGVEEKTVNPVWKTDLVINTNNLYDVLKVVVKDQDLYTQDFMGQRRIPMAALAHGKMVKWVLKLTDKQERVRNKTHKLYKGEILLWMQWRHNGQIAAKRLTVGHLSVVLNRAVELKAMDNALFSSGKSDPYAVMRLSTGSKEKRTETIKNTLNPEWGGGTGRETFEVMDINSDLVVTIFDEDLIGADDVIGKVSIPMAVLETDVWNEGWYELFEDNTKSGKFMCASASSKPMTNPSEARLGYIHLELRLTLADAQHGAMRAFFLPNVAGEGVGESFHPGLLKFNIERLTVALGPLMQLGKMKQDLCQWKDPPRALLALYAWRYVCFDLTLWHVPLLLTAFLLFTGVTATPTRPELFHAWAGQDEVAATTGLTPGEKEEEEEIKKSAKKKKKKKKAKELKAGGQTRNPFKKYKEIMGQAAHVQNTLGDAASQVERVQHALSWRDPLISGVASAGLLCGTLMGAFALYWVDTRSLMWWGGNFQFIKPLMAIVKKEFVKEVEKKDELVRAKKHKPHKDFLARIPDVPQIIHHHICSMQKAHGENETEYNEEGEALLPVVMSAVEARTQEMRLGSRSQSKIRVLSDEAAHAMLRTGRVWNAGKFSSSNEYAVLWQMMAVCVTLIALRTSILPSLVHTAFTAAKSVVPAWLLLSV